MATKTLKEFKTDSRFGYCNTNYAMLALVIEKITGLTYGKNNERNYFLIIWYEKYLCLQL
jgi:CubicO group peptidase (beta-lactamase class C family)